MIDFGVLAAFRQLLIGDTQLQEAGVDQQIHISIPKEADYPCVLVELEEIWTSVRLGAETGFVKLKLKASTYSQKLSSRESLGIADKIRSAVDGQTLDVEGGKQGIVRLSNSIIDMPSQTKPLSVQQYFDVLVR